MSIGLLWLDLYLPECHSLKEKRSCIKPAIARLQKEFNISIAEVAYQDSWQHCQMLIAAAASEHKQAEKVLTRVLGYVESHWPNLPVTNEKLEIIQ